MKNPPFCVHVCVRFQHSRPLFVLEAYFNISKGEKTFGETGLLGAECFFFLIRILPRVFLFVSIVCFVPTLMEEATFSFLLLSSPA